MIVYKNIRRSGSYDDGAHGKTLNATLHGCSTICANVRFCAMKSQRLLGEMPTTTGKMLHPA